MNEKPFAPSCERNREPILKLLTHYLKGEERILEVGSGTGQHAVYFASQFPKLTWITSDVEENHPGIRLWLNEAKAKNIQGPLKFKLGEDEFPIEKVDVLFTANTFHIMPWERVLDLIQLSGRNLAKHSLFIVYGPFKYCGQFTSDSNQKFDNLLRQRGLNQGIRDFEKIKNEFNKNGFELVEDRPMPANNQILVFKKQEFYE